VSRESISNVPFGAVPDPESRPAGRRLLQSRHRCSGCTQVLASRRHEQRRLLKNLADYRWRKNTNTSCFPGTPVETLQLIGEDCATDFELRGNENFERVALHPTRDWRENRETGFSIVGRRRKHNRRPSTGLLMPGSWIERQPDNVAPIGSVLPLTRLRCQLDRQFLFRDGDFEG